MNMSLLISITEAATTADLLATDIRKAHSQACGENPTLELLLRDLIADAMKMKSRLSEIEACLK